MTENRFASDDASAFEAAADEPASPPNRSGADARDALAFAPVPLRYRSDGLTPAKQREFVEALADTGLIHVAAQRIGVSPQAVNRTRRRADARSFDLACAAAQRFGARGLHATAYERAIEGTIKRHYYHGELKSEERVFDNRLLIYLLGKTEHLLDEPPEAAAVAANWEPWVEAMEHGTPLPDIRPAWQKEQDERMAEDAAAEDEEEDETGDDDVWEDEDGGFWWTRFPPPEDFDGVEDGVVGEEEYRRSLTEAEEAAMKGRSEEDARERAEEIIGACARRDSYFGFAGGLDTSMLDEDILEATLKAEQGGFFFAREAETSETSAPDAPNPEPDSGSFQHPATSLAAVESRAPKRVQAEGSARGAGGDGNCSAFPHDFDGGGAYVGRQEEQP
ncbi:MAG: hypothetical protein E6G92_01735 [Alphaproteobacteria bacterium]|nr:MAG: hypothetical protein E6G92_01735 [Alphaproteobacteria bacterium]